MTGHDCLLQMRRIAFSPGADASSAKTLQCDRLIEKNQSDEEDGCSQEHAKHPAPAHIPQIC
jgi:hypothetical protein